MMSEEKQFLDTVNSLLGEDRAHNIYPCVRDLIENGLDRGRFAPGEYPPSRQDVTQYLAAWLRHAGLSYEESSGWMMEYCPGKLGVISKRTPAAIRHSTKGNLRYIYNSQVEFVCQCEKNPFRARCAVDCPLYAGMQAKMLAGPVERPKYQPPPPPPPFVPVKVANRAQFEAAQGLIREEVAKGTKGRKILALLEERGLKTKTGRKWTDTILSNEIRRLEMESQQIPETAPSDASAPVPSRDA